MVKSSRNMLNWVIWRIQIGGRRQGRMLRRPFRQFIFPKSWIANIPQRHVYNWKVGMIKIFCAEITLQQTWTCLRRIVLNWLRRQLMQLLKSLCITCLSRHKGTTLIYVLNWHFSEHYANNWLSVDHFQTSVGLPDLMEICYDQSSS